MSGILLDTDIAIDYLRGVQAAVDFVQRHEKEISLSAVTVAELFAGVRKGDETDKLEGFVGLFPVIPVARGGEDGRSSAPGFRSFPRHRSG